MSSISSVNFGYSKEQERHWVSFHPQMGKSQRDSLSAAIAQKELKQLIQGIVGQGELSVSFRGPIEKMGPDNIHTVAKAMFDCIQLGEQAEEIEPNIFLAVNLQASEDQIREIVDEDTSKMNLALQKAEAAYITAKKSSGLAVEFFTI